MKAGLTQIDAGETTAAIASFKKALALDPLSPAAWNNLARTLALQGRWAEARECYLRALRTTPDFPAAHEGLASVCMTLGRTSEAVAHLQATLRAEPDNHAVASALAQALFEVGKLDDAAALVQRALCVAVDGDFLEAAAHESEGAARTAIRTAQGVARAALRDVKAIVRKQSEETPVDLPKEIQPLKLKTSLGLGFRLEIPLLGNIGFDYGYGFQRDDGPRAVGHFLLGNLGF